MISYKLNNINKKIIIWCKAVLFNYPYWRIEDKNQEWISFFVSKRMAKIIAKESGARAFIDYNFIIDRDKNSK